MDRLCIIYNFAAHYRAPVFQKMDKFFQCDWYFGKKNNDIQKMDYSLLSGSVTELETINLFGLSWQKRVLRLLFAKEYRQYIIFTQTKDLSTWFFSIIARLFFRNKRVYMWSHGFYGKESRVQLFIKKTLFSLPNGGVFLYGNYARNLMIEAGLNPQKLFVIHNSLNYDKQLNVRKELSVSSVYTDHFHNTNNNLVFVGRLTPVKQLDLLLKAVSKLRDDGHVYNVTLIGTGQMESHLKSLSESLGIKDQVWFYGPCYDEVILGQLIYNADLCVSPGNVGLTAMHSMVFGTPVLTHDNFSYQMPEFEAIIPGKTGSFYKYGDIISLSDSIYDWLSANCGRRDAVRDNCMKEIDKNWTPDFQIGVLNKYLDN